jgi:hypothetical protein
MVSDYSASVPGSIGREKNRPVNGLDNNVVYVLAVWAFASLIFLMPIMIGLVSGIGQYVLLCLFLAWWAFFLKYLSTAKHIDKLFLFLNYILRTQRSENVIAKYTQPLSYIATSYPIKDVHEDGFIEYYGATNPYGVILHVDPYRVSDDDLESHQAQLTEVFNSFPEGVKFTVINTSFLDDSQQFINTVRDKANRPILMKKQKEHLASIHLDRVSDETLVVDWTIILSLIFDGAADIKDARIKKGEYVPGIVNGLQEAGMRCYVITDKSEIVMEYRKMLEAPIVGDRIMEENKQTGDKKT